MLGDHHDKEYDKVACMTLEVVSMLSYSEAGIEGAESSTPTAKDGKGVSPAPSSTSSGASKHQVTPRAQPKLNEYFRKFVVELLKMFDSDKALLENKGSFLIRYVGGGRVGGNEGGRGEGGRKGGRERE